MSENTMTTNTDAVPSELHEAARVFHNLTIGDSTVIIRPWTAAKRDAIVAAGERLRAALTAPTTAVQAEAVRADDDLASMTRMVHAACADLGAINEALGLDPNDGGAAPILDAITELKRERDQWVDANYAAPAAPAQRPADDALWDQTLQERDTYHDWADKLADAIGLHLGVDVGEHTSLNNPWNEALDAIMSAPSLAELSAVPAQSVDEEDAFQDWWKTQKGKTTDAYHGWMARAALGENAPAQSMELIGYARKDKYGNLDFCDKHIDGARPVYAAPQPSQPVEAGEACPDCHDGECYVDGSENCAAKVGAVLDDERTAFEAWWKTLPGESNPQERDDDYEADVKAWALTGWQTRVASPQATATQPAQTAQSGNDALFASVTDWMNTHHIPFEAQNELFCILAASPPAPAQRPADDALWDQTLQERDTYHDWADKLADAIGLHLGVDVGEHTSLNNPWNEALNAIMSAPSLAELSAAPVQSGEAVAHILPRDLEALKTYSTQCQVVLYREPRGTRVPLYAAPQPSRPVKAGDVCNCGVDCQDKGAIEGCRYSNKMTNGDFHCPACGDVMKGPTACGSCLWEADTCGYKSAVVLGDQRAAFDLKNFEASVRFIVEQSRSWEKAYQDAAVLYEDLDSYKTSVESEMHHLINMYRAVLEAHASTLGQFRRFARAASLRATATQPAQTMGKDK